MSRLVLVSLLSVNLRGVCVSCRIIGIEYGMVVFFFLRRMKCVKQLDPAMYAWHKEIFNMALDV